MRAVLPAMAHNSQSGHLVQYQPCLWLYIAQGMLETSSIPKASCAVQLTFVGLQNRDCFVSSSVVLLIVVSVQHAVACMVFAEHPIGMMYLMMGQSKQKGQEHTLPSSLRGTPTWTRMSAMLAITISARAAAMTCSTKMQTLGLRKPRAPRQTHKRSDAQAV